MEFEPFHYESVEDIRVTAERLGVHLPLAADTSALLKPMTLGNVTVPNRMGIAPMECAGASADGSPCERSQQRYLTWAESGVGIIWAEATCVDPAGRSGSHQFLINRGNLDAYKRFTERLKEAGLKACGHAPYLVMQASHNGRYSNPGNKPAPLIMYRHPAAEEKRPADDSCILSDDQLKQVEEAIGQGAALAKEAGFDAVDVKASHGYLLAESFSAYNRPGIYGGSFENRTRLLRNCVAAAQAYASEDFAVTARLNIYDGFPYPYGFGVQEGQGIVPCMDEPIAVVRMLQDMGIDFLNLTMGNAYVTTHVMKAYDTGGPVPPEHPFESTATTISCIGQVKRAVPDMTVLASKPSYLREFSDLYAAGAVEEGLCDGMLFGRLAFANPAFAADVRKSGRIDPKLTCVGCGLCSGLIRKHMPTGCIVRDAEYRVDYNRFVRDAF